jgi:hypothetical protein
MTINKVHEWGELGRPCGCQEWMMYFLAHRHTVLPVCRAIPIEVNSDNYIFIGTSAAISYDWRFC